MTAILLPNGKQQYFTTAGLPAVGYKVATFDAGTSNPRVTWQDAAKVAQNTNPVILDGRGEASIFWEGAYKVQLQDSTGAPIWTQDGLQSQQNGFAVSLVPAVTNTVDLGSSVLAWRNLYLGPNGVPALDSITGNVGYIIRTPAEIAAGAAVVDNWYLPGNAYRYGTNTIPGTTDMTAAIQAAINQSAQPGGSAAYVPQNLHKTTATLNLVKFAKLYGDGYFSQIVYTGAGVAIQGVGASTPEVWRRGSVSGLNLTTVGGTHGIRIKDIAEFEVSQNIVNGFSVAGIHLTGTAGSACINLWILSNICINNGKGLLVDGVNNVNQVAIHHNQFEGNVGEGVYIAVAGKGFSIVGNDIEGNGGVAELYINGGNAAGLDIAGNYFETVVNHPMVLIGDTTAAWGVSFKGNFLQSDLAITNGVMLGNAGGEVIGADFAGNSFQGTMTNAINANFVTGGRFGPDNVGAGITHLVVSASCHGILEGTATGLVTRVGGYTGAAPIILTYSASITPTPNVAEWMLIVVTNNSAFTINLPAASAAGNKFVLEFINNTSAMAVPTFAAGYKLAGTFVNPAQNFIRFIEFRFDGASWREIFRSAADEPQ